MLKLGKKKGGDAGGGDDANLPAVAEGEEGEAPAKKKIPLLFIIIPAALVLLGVGGGAAFFLMKPKPAAEAHGEEAAEGGHGAPAKAEEKGGDHGGGGHGGGSATPDPALGKIAAGPDGVTFYTLPDIIVNIQAVDGRQTYLKLVLTLEMKNAATATKLQSEMPRLQDMFQGFLRELRPEDLAGSAGSYQLRAELLRRVNLVAAPDKIDAVLIEEMLVH